MKVAITGASGLIGSALVDELNRNGHEASPVGRRGSQFDTDDLASADAVVHLAGESIGGKLRWNEAHKQRVMRSRVEGTRQISEYLADRPTPPAAFLSASAVGYYGSQRGDELLDEASSSGSGFLAEVCRAWEDSTEAAESAGIRVGHLRTGIVLSPKGGLLPRMLMPGRLGLGAVLGSGKQWISWISLQDEVRAIRFALESSTLQGAVNLVAPAPVTNEHLTKSIGKALSRPAFLKVPASVLRLALGDEAARETVLASQRAQPAVLEAAGFEFTDPELLPALRRMLGS